MRGVGDEGSIVGKRRKGGKERGHLEAGKVDTEVYRNEKGMKEKEGRSRRDGKEKGRRGRSEIYNIAF